MSPKIGKFKKLRIFSGVCSGARRSVTPKFYFTFRCLIHRTTIYLKIKKNAKIAFHTPTSLTHVVCNNDVIPCSKSFGTWQHLMMLLMMFVKIEIN